MDLKDKHAHRLAMLQGVEFSPADLDAILAEVDDIARVIAELEEFCKETPWISQQTQPEGRKV